MSTVAFPSNPAFPGVGFGGGFAAMPLGGASFGGGSQPILGNLMQTAGSLPSGMPGFGAASFSPGCCPCFGGSSGTGMEQSMMMMAQLLAMMAQFLGSQLLGGNASTGAGPQALSGASPSGGGGSAAPGGGGGAPASGGASPVNGGGSAPANETKDKGEIQGFIAQAAQAYGADPKVLTEMARRESNFQTGVVNDWDSNAKKGTPSKGLFQFIEPTFKSYAPKAKAANPQAWAGMGELDWNDWRQQALTAAWAVANGHGSAWSTYKASGGR